MGTYTLDTRGEATTTKVVRKKLSPSTLKRNARRKLEFQNRKANTSENDSTTPEKELISSKKKEADVPPPQHPSSPLAPSPSTGATQAVSSGDSPPVWWRKLVQRVRKRRGTELRLSTHHLAMFLPGGGGGERREEEKRGKRTDGRGTRWLN